MSTVFFRLFSCLLLLTPLSVRAIDCQAEYQRHLASDLALDYETFDQTMNSGMRVLGDAGCHREAADLIEAYIQANQATQHSLRWHIAQLRAMAGDDAAAIASARQVLKSSEDFAANSLRWNDYVQATIAFLEKDRDALQRHRDAVASATGEHFGNALNLRLLDSLIAHFDESYLYAMQHMEP